MGKKSDDRNQRDLLAPNDRLPVGARFGKLFVSGVPFRIRSNDNRHHLLVVCDCACGTPVIVRANRLLNGYVESCGCQRGGAGVPRPNQRRKELTESFDRFPADDLMRFFETVYRPLKLRNRSANTIRLYRFSVSCFSKSLGHRATLTDLTDATVSEHLASLTELGRSRHTVEKERSQLLAIWRFAARKRLIEVWPDVQAEILPKRSPMAWTESEVNKIAQSCRQEPGAIGEIPAALWWSALLRVELDTAERIGALMGLEWSHLGGDGWLTIPAELRKGKREDKVTLLAPSTVEALDAIRKPERTRVFPWPYSATSIFDRLSRILKRAGLPTDSRSKFHRLRRTVATYFELAGGNSQDLLGHSSRATTKRYLDPRILKVKQPSECIFRLDDEVKP